MKKKLLPLLVALGLAAGAILPTSAFAWSGHHTVYSCDSSITNPSGEVVWEGSFRSLRDVTGTYDLLGYTVDIDCE